MSPASQPQNLQTRAVAAANVDLSAQRNEFLFSMPKRLENWCLPLLQDKRDLPILYLFYNVAVTVLPAALALYCLPAWSHIIGPAHLAATDVLFLERFLLALHYSQHRQLFKRVTFGMIVTFTKSAPMHAFHPNCWGHCAHHHSPMYEWVPRLEQSLPFQGNNWYPKDLSSTEPYQRDNFLHFLRYWVRYLAGIWVELPLYAIKAGLWGVVCQCLTMEALYTALVGALCYLNTAATVWTLILPLVITSFALMLGNWSQHIFIDPSKPHSAYGMSYNCVSFSGNQRSFNDGYHTIHHLNSKLHWTQLPQQFIQVAEQGPMPGLTFEGVGFFDVGLAVFLGKFDLLAKHLLSLESNEDAAGLLRDYLKPVCGS